MMSARCIAIIGCGYIGSAVGADLVKRGYRVAGTTMHAQRCGELSELGIEAAVLDINEVDRLHTIIAECETVLLTVAPGRHDGGYREVYYQGVVNLLKAARDTAVKHIIYTSSTGVYGYRDGRWVDEDASPEPATDNGRILRDAEIRLLDGATEAGIDATVLRLAGIYGPGRGPANRVMQFAGQQRSGGDAYVNLIHRDDIVTVLLAAIERPYHGVVNVSDGHPVRRRDLYDRVVSLAGSAAIRWVEDQENPDLGKRVSNDRLREMYAIAFKHPESLRSPEFSS